MLKFFSFLSLSPILRFLTVYKAENGVFSASLSNCGAPNSPATYLTREFSSLSRCDVRNLDGMVDSIVADLDITKKTRCFPF